MIPVYATVTPIIAAFNDRFGDLGCVATRVLPHSQNNAASAKMNNPRSEKSATRAFVQIAANDRNPPLH